ncbi:MAG: DUF2786 domain-containing protein [Thalassospira sp.]|nr:DUF2786 domain-containing protein [Thalassospira sp.]
MNHAAAIKKQAKGETLPDVNMLNRQLIDLRRVFNMSRACIAANVLEDKIKQFIHHFNRNTTISLDRELVLRMAIRAAADGYAMALLTFTPSFSGKTALDRLEKNVALKTVEEKQLLTALKKSTYRVITIESRLADGLYTVRDVCSGETRHLYLGGNLEENPLNTAKNTNDDCFSNGSRWGMRTVDLQGTLLAYGHKMRVEAVRFTEMQRFITPGKPLPRPLHWEEVLFRDFICLPEALDIFSTFAGRLEKAFSDNLRNNYGRVSEFPYSAQDGAIHSLVAKWVDAKNIPAQLDADALRIVRDSVADGDAAMDCFNAIYISSEEPAFKLHHAAYRLIFQAQLETILRREKIYAGSETIRDIEVEIKEIIASGEAESDLWMMYQDILQRAQLAQQGATSKKVTDMAELDKILARIKALRSKTVEQGCTEEEALLAANKVAEMLDHYGLSLTEMDIEQQQCASDIIETDRKRTAAFDSCLNAIAAFCDCRFWFQKSREDTYRHVFFGLPADVAGARYLYERISEAFKTETDAYKKSAAYLDLPSAVRRKATESFQMGLARGRNDKIRRLKDERVQAMQKNAGRNLVVVKSKVIEDDLESLGIRLTATKKRGKSILPEAYESGLVSAETIDLHNRVSGVA